MRTRVVSSVIALALFVPFILLGGGWFALALLVIGLVAQDEMARMSNINYYNIIGVVSSLALFSRLVPSHYLPSVLSNINLTFLFLMCAVLLMIITVFRPKEFTFTKAAILILSALYIGSGFSYLIYIRDMGLDTILYLFVVIWCTDIGAYLIGKRIGRTPLAPEVSPNKTVEGMIGGVVSALICSSIYVYLFQPNLGPVDFAWILTIILSLAGQLGDLVESAYKRHFGVKDSGNLIPGHGGFLDRFDSTLFASIMMMIWMNLFR